MAELIEGVGVLRYPNGQKYGTVDARELARKMAEQIRQGTIICFTSERDGDGNFLWDFHIEGGNPTQVVIERNDVAEPYTVNK